MLTVFAIEGIVISDTQRIMAQIFLERLPNSPFRNKHHTDYQSAPKDRLIIGRIAERGSKGSGGKAVVNVVMFTVCATLFGDSDARNMDIGCSLWR